MKDALRHIMDAMSSMQQAQAILEGQEENAGAPVTTTNGSTTWFACKCGTPLSYGDRYCRMCGQRIRW